VKTFKFFSDNLIPEINLNITTVEVAGDVRTLRAQWTPEITAQLEIRGDITEELSTLLSNELAAEIDREILQNLRAFTLPIATRVMATTIGQDLVAVQPLGAPVGILNYIDFKYRNILTDFKFFRGW
jgi:hypothetical protein